MKKLIAAFAVFGTFAIASAQSITFDQTTYDYGTVKTNSDGHRFFTVKMSIFKKMNIILSIPIVLIGKTTIFTQIW